MGDTCQGLGWDPPPIHGMSYLGGAPAPRPLTFLLQNLRAEGLPVLASSQKLGCGWGQGERVCGGQLVSLTTGPTEARAVWVGAWLCLQWEGSVAGGPWGRCRMNLGA